MRTKELHKNNYKINVNIETNERFWNSYKENSWEPETFVVFDRFIKPDSIYLDIGAWIGPTVLYGAQKAKKVVAVEPDIKAHEELMCNIELNPQIKDKVSAKNVAITPKNGTVKLYIAGSSANSVSSTISHKMSDSYYTVPGITFSELIKNLPIEEISFIKIDVEGAEYSLIPTIGNILRKMKTRPTIHLSLHPPFLLKEPPSNKILRELYRMQKKYKLKHNTTKILKNLNFYKYFYNDDGSIINNLDKLHTVQDFSSIVISDEKW